MSIDLEWNKLDSSLSTYLVDVLNRQLESTQRPSFIGPVQVTSLDFGSVAPDVEIVDMRDIYRDFLEDDEDEDEHLPSRPVNVSESAEDDEGFEWVSRRAAAHDEQLVYTRYGRGPADMFAPSLSSSTPALNSRLDFWNAGMSLPSLPGAYGAPLHRSPSPATPFAPTPPPHLPPRAPLGSPPPAPPDVSAEPDAPPNEHPNLQLHLRITWPSNLRLTLTTSLLINYPSPMFMSLPIKLSVTGLLFTGELAVAYEGARRRVHLCILDDLDPYGPALGDDRPKRNSTSSMGASTGVPPELDDDSPVGLSSSGVLPPRAPKPLPVGQRLLPSIYIESEIGQADKHVLKNVTRVEKFIQDVIRKTIEEELVFPNFHTMVIGEA